MELDFTLYFNLICSIGGIFFFIYSLIIIRKIKELFPGAKIIKKWVLIQILILLFLVGYAGNILFSIFSMREMIMIMTAIVYLFGGLFVFLVINLSYKTYKLLFMQKSPNE